MTHNTDRELIGTSSAFRMALAEVDFASSADCTVLLQGETGTGKELFARAIHEKSSRRSGPFIKVNCSAIPAGLLESELFGHERGAFTGAVTQTNGRFRLADGGTIFLDEIGDLPLELQPKLLRVLQEKEFERLGSARTIQVDIRVVAATNQPLQQMVHERKFRSDLYYRLDVFPISLPPLRERREDIPALVRHFVERFAARARKKIDCIPAEVITSLQLHDWPGNIRELQNYLERAVLLTSGEVLTTPRKAFAQKIEERTAHPVCTLKELERSSIAEALRRSNGVIGGSRGAAAELGLPRTTLIARMSKLGISRQAQPLPTGGLFDDGNRLERSGEFSNQRAFAATA
jgi:formate hydrogenlyase transcriptional activator